MGLIYSDALLKGNGLSIPESKHERVFMKGILPSGFEDAGEETAMAFRRGEQPLAGRLSGSSVPLRQGTSEFCLNYLSIR